MIHHLRARPVLLLALGALAAGCGQDDARHYGNAPDPDSFVGELVSGLEVAGVSINQAVEVPLMADGAAVAGRPIPVIRGKDALLRVGVRTLPGWRDREVKVRVELVSELAEVAGLEARRMVTGDSTSADFDSTFNLPLPGEYLAGDLRFRVSLHEMSLDAPLAGDTGGAQWPAADAEPAAVHEIDPGGGLELVLVPVRYNADGSGRLPPTGEIQRQFYAEYVYAMYPVPGVNIQVHEPLDFELPITSGGDGWGELLNAIVQLRASNGARHNEYYYGLFSPAESMQAYCGRGCVAGLSNLAWRPGDAWARASIGLGFGGEQSASTLAHEVGHAHGRLHAPCGIDDEYYDFDYPYDQADIGVPGYDVIRERSWGPEEAKDIMSYCGPSWISDHNYVALYQRAVAIHAQMSVVGAPTTTWYSLTITLSGGLVRGPTLDLELPPEGEARAVQWLGANGEVLGEVAGIFQPFSEAPAGLVFTRAPPADATAARVPGSGTVEL